MTFIIFMVRQDMANINAFCLIHHHSNQPNLVSTDIEYMKLSNLIYCWKESLHFSKILMMIGLHQWIPTISCRTSLCPLLRCFMNSSLGDNMHIFYRILIYF